MNQITFPSHNILLVSAGVFHPPLLARYWLRRFLAGLHGYTLQRAGSLEVLPAMDLGHFQGLVLYYHQSTISDATLGALEGFVSSGGGVLAIHSASASFKQSQRYFEILGGRFASHGPVASFKVNPSAMQDEIFAGIPAFTVRDELYLHEFCAEVRAHFYAEYEGEQAPMVWTRVYSQGRVCYACLGHTAASVRHPIYQQILQRGLAWVCQTLPEEQGRA